MHPLTTGNTATNEQESLGLELLNSAGGVGVVRVATVDDNVTLLEERLELLNEGIHGGTSLDEKDDLSRGLQLGDKLSNGFGALDLGAYSHLGSSFHFR